MSSAAAARCLQKITHQVSPKNNYSVFSHTRSLNRLCGIRQRSSLATAAAGVVQNHQQEQDQSSKKSKSEALNKRLFSAGLVSSLLGLYAFHQSQNKVSAKDEEEKGKVTMSRREQRFNEFASFEYKGQIIMSPQDFIESITENQPKLARRGKIRMTEKDLKNVVSSTPSMNYGSNTFMRDRHDTGIITFSEYLFLVTVLTKSYTGLKTALKMMDVNGDKVISLEEFELIVKMINKSASQSTRSQEDGSEKPLGTTLLIHLFGRNGDQSVTFDRFFKFMDDLQSEVLELEFHEYSKSMKTISEIDFAKILLRNTILSEQEFCQYLDRLKSRLELAEQSPKGITLEQFKAFHAFLSNIEDFVIAVNMTNMLNQPVDKELFTRSIKVTTGKDVDPYVVDVVFYLFDQDGDGKLSQQEFIGIMKDRLKRGFGKFPNTSGFAGFKHCLKKEMVK